MTRSKKADATNQVSSANTTPKKNPAAHLAAFKWQPGQVPNPTGRPKGSRNKLGEAFLLDMLNAWTEKGKAAIDRVIEERPHEFIKAVAGILPKEVNVKTTAVEELTDDELSAALIALRSVLASQTAGDGGEAASRH
jgi:Family of unknown function (DUF5681)